MMSPLLVAYLYVTMLVAYPIGLLIGSIMFYGIKKWKCILLLLFIIVGAFSLTGVIMELPR